MPDGSTQIVNVTVLPYVEGESGGGLTPERIDREIDRNASRFGRPNNRVKWRTGKRKP